MSKFGIHANKSFIKGSDITPLPGIILVTDIEKGDKLTKGGIILPDDDGKDRGIRARWAKVWKVGKNIDYLIPGDWVLISHGRWTRAIYLEVENNEPIEIRSADPDEILMTSDTNPLEN